MKAEYSEAELMNRAIEAMEYAYSPYSKFQVGAALLASSGKVYTGCNVENASFGATVCAERTVLVKAVSEGERKFVAIAIASNMRSRLFPCGICRQSLSEFGEMDVLIEKGVDDHSVNHSGGVIKYKLSELIPSSFGAKDMS